MKTVKMCFSLLWWLALIKFRALVKNTEQTEINIFYFPNL